MTDSMELQRDPMTPARSQPGYILVAVTNVAKARTLTAGLETIGREIVCVRDGSEARRELMRETPALMLCDLSLPKIDGFGLVRELRQLAPRQFASGDMADQSHAKDQQGLYQQDVNAPPARQQSPGGP